MYELKDKWMNPLSATKVMYLGNSRKDVMKLVLIKFRKEVNFKILLMWQ